MNTATALLLDWGKMIKYFELTGFWKICGTRSNIKSENIGGFFTTYTLDVPDMHSQEVKTEIKKYASFLFNEFLIQCQISPPLGIKYLKYVEAEQEKFRNDFNEKLKLASEKNGTTLSYIGGIGKTLSVIKYAGKLARIGLEIHPGGKLLSGVASVGLEVLYVVGDNYEQLTDHDTKLIAFINPAGKIARDKIEDVAEERVEKYDKNKTMRKGQDLKRGEEQLSKTIEKIEHNIRDAENNAQKLAHDYEELQAKTNHMSDKRRVSLIRKKLIEANAHLNLERNKLSKRKIERKEIISSKNSVIRKRGMAKIMKGVKLISIVEDFFEATTDLKKDWNSSN